MTSYYAVHGRLRPQTLEASTQINSSIGHYLLFYGYYLQDVAPHGVTVHHIPSGPSTNSRQELELRTPTGRVFMSGLISREMYASVIEGVAADEAYTTFRAGDFERDGGNWRFFTGLRSLRFYICNKEEDWQMVWNLRPDGDVAEVADYLQREYQGLTLR